MKPRCEMSIPTETPRKNVSISLRFGRMPRPSACRNFPTICFMNNPYDETLVAKTARHVHQSLRSAPRPFFIIYINAYYTRPFDTTGEWSRICCGSLGRSSYVIWKWIGSGIKSQGIGSGIGSGSGSYGRSRRHIMQYPLQKVFRPKGGSP